MLALIHFYQLYPSLLALILISLEFINNESLYFRSITHKDLIIFILEKVNTME
jgi:hypothetical protein